MPTTMTLEGVRMSRFKSFLRNLGPRRLGDAWSDDATAAATPTVAAGSNAAADFTTAALGWGVLAFAAGSALFRGTAAVRKLFK